jgi:hypothetical protein|nr:MAG TPA: hypothetical protein [Caudoviricetes sp.]
MNLVIEVSFTEDTGIYVSAEDQKIQFIENLVAKSPDGSYRVPENFMNEVDNRTYKLLKAKGYTIVYKFGHFTISR